jgi:citrate lyase subunit beta/citryl-CoA lyase
MNMTPLARPRRSAIYLPASSARALEKARSLPCDVVILDLEDSVEPDAKHQARAAAVEAIRDGGFGDREIVLRVNGLDTPWGPEDMAAAAEAHPDAVLVPKILGSRELTAARKALGSNLPIWAMIETCAAMLSLREIGAASVTSGVNVWVIGSSDLAKDMGCIHTVERPGLVTALSMSVMTARTFGLAILDGVFIDIPDLHGLAVQCAQAAALGFDGKTVLHPRQLDATNAAFTPDSAASPGTRTAAYGLAGNAQG